MVNPSIVFFSACFLSATFEYTRVDTRVTDEQFALIKKVVGLTKHEVQWDLMAACNPSPLGLQSPG